jgi:hypothetical protein
VNGFLAEWFQSYEGYSVGDFITENIYREEFDTEYGEAYRIGCKAWLAPFDLGVSQHIKLETVPTDLPDVYDLRLTLTRVSGDISNWKRVNRRFLNTLRKQFLIWRTLNAAERERYLEELETPAEYAATHGGARPPAPAAPARRPAKSYKTTVPRDPTRRVPRKPRPPRPAARGASFTPHIPSKEGQTTWQSTGRNPQSGPRAAEMISPPRGSASTTPPEKTRSSNSKTASRGKPSSGRCSSA